jgi:hypothetical protein
MAGLSTTRIAALACIAAFICLITSVSATKVTTLTDVLYNGTVTAESTSGAGSLDGQKLSSTSNYTTYEW